MIVSRIAICLPRDERLNDMGVSARGDDIPGGRWLANPIVAHLKERGATIVFFEADPAQYWWIEVTYRGVRFMLTVGHVFPYECIVTLLTRRGIIDRILCRDHRAEAESLFSVICHTIRSERRAGECVTWEGPSNVRDEQQFLARARKMLRRDQPC